MKKIILNRPKSFEKYYDETKYKIFINGSMVTKLKRGEPVELKVDDVIEIQAKVAYWGSGKERIELSDEVTEIDIARNPRFPYNNFPYIYLVFLTALFPLIRFIGGWSTLLIVVLVAAYVIYVIKYDIINRHNYILIKKHK